MECTFVACFLAAVSGVPGLVAHRRSAWGQTVATVTRQASREDILGALNRAEASLAPAATSTPRPELAAAVSRTTTD